MTFFITSILLPCFKSSLTPTGLARPTLLSFHPFWPREESGAYQSFYLQLLALPIITINPCLESQFSLSECHAAFPPLAMLFSQYGRLSHPFLPILCLPDLLLVILQMLAQTPFFCVTFSPPNPPPTPLKSEAFPLLHSLKQIVLSLCDLS